MVKSTTIFVFAYYSFKDPVFQSAVLPYLKHVQDKNLRYVLLTWEQKEFEITNSDHTTIKKELSEYNIIWHRSKWHSGRFKIIKKAYDFMKGLVLSLFLIYKYKAHKIYSEGFPGAIFGHFLSKITGRHHIIHTFEPHANYMLESGVWNKTSWEYLFLKKMEIPIARHAQHIITATEAYKEILIEQGVHHSSVQVIPSCIDTEHYSFDIKSRIKIRNELNLRDEQIVIVYLGKIGGMYMEDELFKFFQHCLNLDGSRFFFFLFTNYPSLSLIKQLDYFQIPEDKILSKYLSKEDVSKYLSAADIGFCGIRPIPSRRYSSPIKNGEYWACGLPTLIPEGISDDYLICEKYKIGKSFRSIEQLTLLCFDQLTTLDRTRITDSATEIRGIKSYIQLFKNIFID